jgi:hypothetical protein
MGEGGHMVVLMLRCKIMSPLVMVLFWSIKNIKRKRSIVRRFKSFWKIISKYVDNSKEEAKINKSSQKNFIEEGEASPRTSRRIKI